jgi:single-stranded-DNA-specific exonuclease
MSLPPLTVLGRRYVPAPAINGAAHALAQQTGLPLPVAHLLAQRGQTSAEAATRFLSHRLDQLPDPSTLTDLDKAAGLLADALQNHHKIAIFGDYDVDGTCATALLTLYLRRLGANPELYIPHRLTEGYGPTPAAMQELKKRGVDTLITVDTGTSAHAALAEAQTLGLQVIVTDHHQPGATLPPCAALLNPHRADDTSGLTELCGSGVAFYLIMGLNRELRQRGYFGPERPEPRLHEFLDLVALATIADVMPLTGLNRVLVTRGLQQLATGRHPGLAALSQVAGLKTADAGSVGFGLAPRLNAAGRIDSAQAALDLLLATDEPAAVTLATMLNSLNGRRRDEEKSVLRQALHQADETFDDAQPALVLAGDWHPGVVGIVAARIKERFNRPAFVLGAEDGGTLKGSGRSVPGLDLGAAVRACETLLLSGGGHAMAAGVTLKAENLESFRQALNAALLAQLAHHPEPGWPLHLKLTPALTPHLDLPLTAATVELVQTLAQLAPFGVGNEEPLLALTDAQVTFCQPVGDGSHLKLRLTSLGGPTLNAIAFGCAETPLGKLLKTTAQKPLTLFGTLKISSFNQKPDLQVTDALPL